MKQSLSNQKYVHCHICPMKDLCEFGLPEKSYQHHNVKDVYYFSFMAMVTANCPLRKLLESKRDGK